MRYDVQGATVSFLVSCQEKLITEDGTNSDFVFRGQAIAVQAEAFGIPTTLANTGALAKAGGAREASLLTRNIADVLTAKVIYSSTIGQGDRSRSEAALADLRLTVGKDSITVGFLMARAMAVCGPSVSGSSEIADLIVNGKAIVVSGQPNQKISLPNRRVVINEQKSSVKGNAGDMTVNALHVIVDGVTDIVISFEVVVADNGEPGRDDTFVLKLSNGYNASGNWGGGNIQLHKPCQ